MRGVLARGVAGSVLMAAGGFCYERLPHQTWFDRVTPVWRVRGSAHPLAWGICLSVAGLVLLTWAWWDLRHQVRDDPAGLRRVWLAAGAWAAPLLLAPPLLSGDGWSYVATGDLAGRGLSPYVWTPAALPTPLRSGVSPQWLDTPSPYGPLSVAWGSWLSHLVHDPWVLLTWYRVLAVLGLVLMAWAVPILARRAGRNPVDASALVVASPFVLAHGVGGLHNDLTMAGLVLAAFAVTGKGRWLAGAVVVAVAAAVKAPGLLGVAGVVLLSLPPDAGWLARFRRTVEVGALATAVLLAIGWLTGLGTGWVGALLVPESEHTELALTWVAGREVRTLLLHGGTVGAHVVHLLHPAMFAKKLGLVLLVLAAAWVTLVRRLGSPARALSGAALVMTTAVVLSPAGHYWYFLWCVPLLACLPLRPAAYRALVAGILTLGLTAPADAHLHHPWVMRWAAVAVYVVPLVVGLMAAFGRPGSRVALPPVEEGPGVDDGRAVSGRGSC